MRELVDDSMVRQAQHPRCRYNWFWPYREVREGPLLYSTTSGNGVDLSRSGVFTGDLLLRSHQEP
jgi:hypothetical protein